MRYSMMVPTGVLACVLVLACADTTSPGADEIEAGTTDAAAKAQRPFGGSCTFTSTVLPPEQGQPPNVVRFRQDEVCRVTHLGLTTAITEETVTFTETGLGFITTIVYTAASGDQLFTTQTGTAAPPDQGGVIHFTGTEAVNGGTGRFADASGSFTFEGTVTPATLTGEVEYLGGSLSY
jgi:hypothetical protein